MPVEAPGPWPSPSTPLASLDVYDTAVLRPFARPADLFNYIEEAEGAEGFASARVSAEARSRRGVAETSLDRIYAELGSEYSGLERIELSLESSLVLPNPAALEFLSRMDSEGREVVLISDMYLPSATVRAALERCGISRPLYVSSEAGATKHSGGLFRRVLEDLGAGPSDLTHYGDNPRSDFGVPRSMGVAACRTVPPMEAYLRSFPEASRYLRRGGLDRSVVVSMDMLRSIGAIGGPEGWALLGWRFGGPLAHGCTDDMLSDARGRLLFAARDGYTPMRIARERGFRDCRYVHLQRILSYVLGGSRIPYGPLEVPDRVTRRYDNRRVLADMAYVLGFLRDDLRLDAIPTDPGELETLYNSRVGEIDALRRSKRAEYSEYLREACGDGPVEIVDGTTMRFTSQRLLEEMTGRGARAHYLVTLDDDPSLEYRAYHAHRGPILGWTRVNVPEFLLSSPELPLRGWSGGPVYDQDAPPFERERASVYREVSDGEVAYSRDLRRVFAGRPPAISYGAALDWSMLSAVPGTEARRLLDGMRWASGPAHGDWHGLVPTLRDVPYLAKKLVTDLISDLNRPRGPRGRARTGCTSPSRAHRRRTRAGRAAASPSPPSPSRASTGRPRARRARGGTRGGARRGS